MVRRNTRQRTVILEELQKLSTHPTANDLYQIVRQRLPRISLGTVYRNLELLARTGVIKKLDTGGSQARYDGNPEGHYHVRCVGCGKVDDFHDAPDNLAENGFKNLNGYKILGYHLHFFGKCPECSNASNALRKESS